MKIEDYEITFGNEKAQEDFVTRYLPLFKSLPHLKAARETAIKHRPQNSFEVRLMFVIQQIICEEDFDAVVTLLANGLSMPAMQILRGMFERTVALGHLGNHADQGMIFWQYYWINQHDRLKKYPDNFSHERREEIESNNIKVRQERKEAGYRDMRFWSGSHTRQMATELGLSEKMIEYAFDRPLEETHGTAEAILRRIEIKEDGRLNFSVGAKPAEDNITLMFAHDFVYRALEVLKDQAGVVELADPLRQCEKDFKDIWREITRGF